MQRFLRDGPPLLRQDGKLVIHHGRQYQVMTNSPIFSEQIPLAAYWKSIGGETMLPGTNRATDRFARASYYINEVTDIAGEQTKNFKPAELFKFLAPTE